MVSRSGVCRSFVTVMLLLGSLPLFAQATPGTTPPATPAQPTTAASGATDTKPAALPSPLTLQQALDLALRSHPDVISAQAAAVSAAASADALRATRWPQLTLEAGAAVSKSLARPTSSGSSASTSTRSTTRNADIALGYTVYQTGRDTQIRRLETLARASQLGIPDTQRLLTYSVRQAYYNILAQRGLARVQLQAIASAERHREQVQARIDAGTAAASDLLPVEVEVAQARLASTQAETQLETDYAVLRALLLLPAGTALDLADTLPSGVYNGELPVLLQAAEKNRPDLEAQRLSVKAAQLATKVAQQQAGVTISANASADYGRFTGVTGDTWTLSVGASYPLFDAGQSRDAITSARANEVIAQQRLHSQLLQMQQDVESAYSRLRQSAQAIETATVARRAAETALAAAETRYRESLAIVIEVTDAELALQQAQVSEIQARYDYAIALAALTLAVGTELPSQQVMPSASQ